MVNDIDQQPCELIVIALFSFPQRETIKFNGPERSKVEVGAEGDPDSTERQSRSCVLTCRCTIGRTRQSQE